ncbi:MAG: CHAT domain-containing protein [Deltaproteobacteria bacterium]|nr:MAG: CHAT domain-containing protein [Deltaproteobacteria bacterium]
MTAVLLAFANDWIDDKRHLRSLLDEAKAIGKALGPAVKAGVELLPPLHNATVGDVTDAFRAHHDQIRVFHFGGHASGSALLFEDETGNPTEAHARGLAGYLGQQPGLVLVFLNGCSTEPQVRRLRAAGVKAVVATTHAIQDAVAAELAEAFYVELAVRPLRSAFDPAVHALQMRWGDDPRAVTRDVAPHDEPHTASWPWGIDCDPAYEDWTLGAELAQQRRRTRWQHLRLAAAATVLLLPLSLVVSADARRTACRAPGLHSLCAVIGTGGVPTAKEQALWEDARAQPTGDGLRAYLQTDSPVGSRARWSVACAIGSDPNRSGAGTMPTRATSDPGDLGRQDRR